LVRNGQFYAPLVLFLVEWVSKRLHAGSVRYGRLGNPRYIGAWYPVSSCANSTTGFWEIRSEAILNVTGVDRK